MVMSTSISDLFFFDFFFVFEKVRRFDFSCYNDK